MAKTLDGYVDDIRNRALVEAELAAGECPAVDLPATIAPTPEIRRLWALAYAAGVVGACQAIRKLRRPTRTACGNG